MDQERSAAITIGGKEYELVLTTRATKEIAGRYGGLENLGDKLMKSENFEMALDEIIWLITLLANQSVLIHNLRPAIRKPSWKLCTRAPSATLRARPTQKTGRSGNRRRTVYPAFLLRYRPAGIFPRGDHAPALRPSSGSVGVPQAISRPDKTQAGADH